MQTKDSFQPKESFQCKECPKFFSSKGTLKTHVVSIHGNSLSICPKCGQQFNRKSSLTKHTLTCGVKELLYKCEVCDKNFDKKTKLLIHNKAQHKGNVFKCVICEKQFSGNAWLKKHTLSCTEKVTFECSICMKQFTGEDRFTKHQLMCTPIIRCEFCSKQFLTNSNLKRHMINQHVNKCQQPILWKIDGVQIIPKKNLIIKNINFEKKIKQNVVQINESVNIREIVKSVIEDTLTDIFNFKCHECTKSFVAKDTLTRHLRVVHNISNKTKQLKIIRSCNVCSKRFDRPAKLKQHLLSHETPENSMNRYDCNICCKKFKQKRILKVHIKRFHKSELEPKSKLFACTYCENSYVRKFTLQRHIMSCHKIHKVHKGAVNKGPIILNRNWKQNCNKINSAVTVLSKLTKNNEEVAEKVLSKFLQNKPHITKA